MSIGDVGIWVKLSFLGDLDECLADALLEAGEGSIDLDSIGQVHFVGCHYEDLDAVLRLIIDRRPEVQFIQIMD